MKPKLLFTLAASLALSYVQAQSLSPTVISSSGAFYSNGSGMLSSTIGEMTMVSTLSSGGSILTQGFQQADDINVGIHEQALQNAPGIYPNPTSGNMTIEFPKSFSGEVVATVYDAIGKVVFLKTYYPGGQSGNIHLSLDGLITGMYLFEVKTKSEKYFSKINLIK